MQIIAGETGYKLWPAGVFNAGDTERPIDAGYYTICDGLWCSTRMRNLFHGCARIGERQVGEVMTSDTLLLIWGGDPYPSTQFHLTVPRG
jgi:hypothetical protein